MQAFFETLFDLVYLATVITLGIRMIRGGNGRKQYLLFGVTAVTLGCGNAFPLVPRAIALCTRGAGKLHGGAGHRQAGHFCHHALFYVKAYWNVAGSPVLKCAITNERLAQAGYSSILVRYESLHSSD